MKPVTDSEKLYQKIVISEKEVAYLRAIRDALDDYTDYGCDVDYIEFYDRVELDLAREESELNKLKLKYYCHADQ